MSIIETLKGIDHKLVGHFTLSFSELWNMEDKNEEMFGLRRFYPVGYRITADHFSNVRVKKLKSLQQSGLVLETTYYARTYPCLLVGPKTIGQTIQRYITN